MYAKGICRLFIRRCRRIRSLGGGAASGLWLQMKADITGKTIKTLKCKDVACLGSAMFAFKALGIFESYEDFHPQQCKPNT
jgi:xylulokinase